MGSRSKQQGFSLIEIIVVLVITGLLFAIVLAPTIHFDGVDCKQRVIGDLGNIEIALKLYKLDNSVYPTTEQGLAALVSLPAASPVPRQWRKGGYMPNIPKDPSGNEYTYVSPGKGHPFEVYTLGEDGAPGCEGMAADFSLKGSHY